MLKVQFSTKKDENTITLNRFFYFSRSKTKKAIDFFYCPKEIIRTHLERPLPVSLFVLRIRRALVPFCPGDVKKADEDGPGTGWTRMDYSGI